MMDSLVIVHYLFQRQADLETDLHWLGPLESRYLNGLRFRKRRNNWLLSRWTAKATLLRLDLATGSTAQDWQIVPAASGAPTVLLNGQPSDIPISLSHSGDLGLCVTAECPVKLGCDLEIVEPRTRSFEETFFSGQEVALLDAELATERDRLVTLFWSGKEAALKVLKIGLRADTRRIRIIEYDRCGVGEWLRLKVQDSEDGTIFQGWWRNWEGMVMTVLSDHLIDHPIPL